MKKENPPRQGKQETDYRGGNYEGTGGAPKTP